MSLFRRLDQLCRDAHAVSAAPNAPLQQITDTQFPGNLRGGLFCILIVHGRRSRDYSELRGLELAELRSHLLGETVGKIILMRVPTQIYKGKDRKHGFLRGSVPWLPEMPRYQNPRYR